MKNANNKLQKTRGSLLLASTAALLFFAPLAFSTPMDVSQAPARASASSSGAVTNSAQSTSGASAYAAQVQSGPDQASLFGGSTSSVNGRSVVPEPGTILLIGLGLLGAGAVRRSR